MGDGKAREPPFCDEGAKIDKARNAVAITGVVVFSAFTQAGRTAHYAAVGVHDNADIAVGVEVYAMAERTAETSGSMVASASLPEESRATGGGFVAGGHEAVVELDVVAWSMPGAWDDDYGWLGRHVYLDSFLLGSKRSVVGREDSRLRNCWSRRAGRRQRHQLLYILLRYSIIFPFGEPRAIPG